MVNQKFFIITIDGTAGSGKSTTAKGLANYFNLMHLNTGLYYRSLTWYLIKNNINLNSKNDFNAFKKEIKLETKIENNIINIIFNGLKVPYEVLRKKYINDNVSKLASLNHIRKFLFKHQKKQKEIAKDYHFKGLVAEGRDTGTKIFPEAEFSFFLEADIKTRISRRNMNSELDEIVKRDFLDSIRKHDPLSCSNKAFRINTSFINEEMVIKKIINIINHKLNL